MVLVRFALVALLLFWQASDAQVFRRVGLRLLDAVSFRLEDEEGSDMRHATDTIPVAVMKIVVAKSPVMLSRSISPLFIAL